MALEEAEKNWIRDNFEHIGNKLDSHIETQQEVVRELKDMHKQHFADMKSFSDQMSRIHNKLTIFGTEIRVFKWLTGLIATGISGLVSWFARGQQ